MAKKIMGLHEDLQLVFGQAIQYYHQEILEKRRPGWKILEGGMHPSTFPAYKDMQIPIQDGILELFPVAQIQQTEALWVLFKHADGEPHYMVIQIEDNELKN